MALRRTHSSEYEAFHLSRKDKGAKVTAHPGFMSTSPRSSSAHTNSDESKNSESQSGFIHNLMAPLSSHLLSSGFSNGQTSKLSSKPSSSRSNRSADFTYQNQVEPRSSPSKESLRNKDRVESKNYSSFHYNCTNPENRNTCSKSRDSSPKTCRVPSKPPTPGSSHSSRTKSQSPSRSNYQQDSRPSSRDYSKQSVSHQINVLKEKYSKLKEDYNVKVEEVSSARVELEGAIKEAVDKHRRCEVAEQKAADLILRIKEAEFEKIKCSSSRDRILEMENQLIVAKQKHNESLEDVEDARRILQQQLDAVEHMRKLYMETEQLAEEQSRKLGTLESENERLSEQIALSMDQAREQFHLQVFELGPLADSVSRLNESIMINKEKKYRADKKAEMVQNEISQLTNRNEELKAKLADMRELCAELDKDKDGLRETIDSKQEERKVAKADNYTLRAKMKDLEELNNDKELKISMKTGEVRDLSARLETLREECARQVSSNKNALFNARKGHLKRLTILEKELAKTKADENAAEKERDEIRLRLEDQILSLSQNLSQAQEKIRNLQDSLGYINKDRNVRVRRISNPHSQPLM